MFQSPKKHFDDQDNLLMVNPIHGLQIRNLKLLSPKTGKEICLDNTDTPIKLSSLTMGYNELGYLTIGFKGKTGEDKQWLTPLTPDGKPDTEQQRRVIRGLTHIMKNALPEEAKIEVVNNPMYHLTFKVEGIDLAQAAKGLCTGNKRLMFSDELSEVMEPAAKKFLEERSQLMKEIHRKPNRDSDAKAEIAPPTSKFGWDIADKASLLRNQPGSIKPENIKRDGYNNGRA